VSKEWTIHIESAPGAVETDEAIADLQDALIAGGIALGPACSEHIPTRTVSATYQVMAPDVDGAAQRGADAFRVALRGIGSKAAIRELLVALEEANAEAVA
jgi:hypothetical protein